jgi:hypothetical protein
MQMQDKILTVYRTMSKEQPYNGSATKALSHEGKI